jgi:hypothetical protein
VNVIGGVSGSAVIEYPAQFELVSAGLTSVLEPAAEAASEPPATTAAIRATERMVLEPSRST